LDEPDFGVQPRVEVIGEMVGVDGVPPPFGEDLDPGLGGGRSGTSGLHLGLLLAGVLWEDRSRSANYIQAVSKIQTV
jgi:hypothetical protein